jgi:hypothetical protein
MAPKEMEHAGRGYVQRRCLTTARLTPIKTAVSTATGLAPGLDIKHPLTGHQVLTLGCLRNRPYGPESSMSASVRNVLLGKKTDQPPTL